MAEAAISFLLDNLKQLVVHYSTLIASTKSEVENLGKVLERMKSVLEENVSKTYKRKDFKTWEKQIREVVYEIEDVFDEWAIQAANDSSRRFKLSLSRLDLAEEVKRIREKVESVFKQAMLEFNTLPMSDVADEQSRNANRIRQIELPVDKQIVGFEDAIDELIRDLKMESSEVEVISIVGMPGLGKTTVASKIYNDRTISFEFTKLIWINVSEEWNKKDIYLSILKKFTTDDMSSESESCLAKKVTEKLNQVKFLLVADDIWTVPAWEAIKESLPMKKGSCKVLITSRDDQVAKKANPWREPYHLRFLDDEESWKLLQMEVYGGEGRWPKEWEGIGKKIAKDCGGLPLALVVVGGILVKKISTPDATRNAWTKVSKSVVEYTMAHDKGRIMEKIIALSYEKLPYHLRDCFLYLGVFPEDFEINTWNLKCLWIAEGFLMKGYETSSLEEIADENIKELIDRNLVMVCKTNALGEAKTCRVHDMIREFCKKEGHELNFAQEIKKVIRHGDFDPKVSEIHKFRRVCIHSSIVEFFNEKPVGPHTRSFLCYSKQGINVPSESLSPFFKKFPLLRVFEGNTMKISKIPKELLKFIHLRYLSLAGGDNFKVLPENIGKLWNLQTLVITTSSRTFEIKADISTMERLRHLKTNVAIILTKDKKSAPNKNLQTLSWLSTSSCKDEVLSNSPNIKVLGIHGDLDTLLNNVNLQKLACLTKLKLIYYGRVTDAMSKLPEPIFFPQNMKMLSLSATKLDWCNMRILSMLLTLEVLKLQEHAFKGEKWDDSGDGFHRLHSLQIERSDLVTWTISESSFRSLGSLVLKNCEKLDAIPLGLAKTLHTLEIERVTVSVVHSAVDIENEKEKNPEKQSIAGRKFKLRIAPGDLKNMENQQLQS